MTDTLFGTRHAFPDTAEALRRLKEQGIVCGIASTTDTDSLEHFLRQNAMNGLRCFTSEDMRVYKPSPRFYTTILEQTGWDVKDCLFVGDNITDDVLGPQSVGMKAALIDRKNTFRDASVSPDYVIRTLTELADIVR